MFNPLCTAKVWLPKYVPSEIISLNHSDIHVTKLINANIKKQLALEKPCIVNTPEHVNVNKQILEFKGQGEGETR